MSTLQEIEAAISKLSRAELEQFHAWYEDHVEAQLELTAPFSIIRDPFQG